MRLRKIKDLDKLPSVLDVEEVSERLIELVEILYRDSIAPLKGAEAINDLIGYQGNNESGLSVEASHVLLDWIKKNYDASNEYITSAQTANLANLTCMEAKVYLNERLELSNSESETAELQSALDEIYART